MLDEEAIRNRVNEIVPRRITEGMVTGNVSIMRNLETLIEQFNRASEVDRASRIATGETYWIEIEGVRTTMVRAWLNELSIQEKLIFESYLSQAIDQAAKDMGLGDWQQHFKDVGEKIFSGLEMGLPPK